MADDKRTNDQRPTDVDDTSVRASRDGLVGEVLLDRYEIRDFLARGGMGAVYVARDMSELKLDVAVKVLDLSDTSVDGADLERRFRHEAEAIARLRSPHILKVQALGRTRDDRLFMVTELLEGQPLNAAMISRQTRRVTPMDPRRVLTIMIATCRALAEAHAVGIVHRDIKPGNIFLATDRAGEENVKVLDFGIAKVTGVDEIGSATSNVPTKTGVAMGTANYMPPEQLDGSAVPNSDLYSLGCCAYHCLTGRLPFSGDTRAVLASHVAKPPPPFPEHLGIPSEIEAIVLRLMSKDPDERAADAKSLRAELESLSARLPALDSRADAVFPDSHDRPSPERPTRRRQAFIAAGLMAGVVVGVAVSLVSRTRAPLSEDVRSVPLDTGEDTSRVPVAEPGPALESRTSAPPKPRIRAGAREHVAPIRVQGLNAVQVEIPPSFETEANTCVRKVRIRNPHSVSITVDDRGPTVVAKANGSRNSRLEACLGQAAGPIRSNGLGVLHFRLDR